MLVYHNIEKDADDPLTITPAMFESQIAWLVKAGFKVISLGEALEQLRQPNADIYRRVVLTFDDGYTNFEENAFPILEKFRLTATVFIVTDKTGKKSDWNQVSISRPLMSLADLQELAKKGYTIGSHSANHARLTDIAMPNLRYEVQISKYFLEEQVGITQFMFSYPYGAYTKREKQAVREAGYMCACGSRGIWGNKRHCDQFSLSRVEVYSHHSLPQFRSILDGMIPWSLLVDSANRQAYAVLRLLHPSKSL